MLGFAPMCPTSCRRTRRTRSGRRTLTCPFSGSHSTIDFYDLPPATVSRLVKGEGVSDKVDVQPVVRIHLTSFELMQLIRRVEPVVRVIQQYLPEGHGQQRRYPRHSRSLTVLSATARCRALEGDFFTTTIYEPLPEMREKESRVVRASAVAAGRPVSSGSWPSTCFCRRRSRSFRRWPYS
jgi:hypothetical protein